MAITLYGIPNCDTVKKARDWLEGRGLVYSFHDYKKAGIDSDRVKFWCDELGWDVVLNKGGTTYKQLPPERKEGLTTPKAIPLMVEQPSMIKRPLVEHDGGLLIGFKPGQWEDALK